MKKTFLILFLSFLVISNLFAQYYSSFKMPDNFNLSGLWIREAVIDGKTHLGAYFMFDKDLFWYHLSSVEGPAMWSGKYKLNNGQITFIILKHLDLIIPYENIAVYNAWVEKNDNGDTVGISFSYGLNLEDPRPYFLPSHFK